MEEGTKKSRVLIFGGTGYIGKHIVRASAAEGHPTALFIRPETLQSKPDLIASFKSLGVTFVQGSLEDHACLVAAVKGANVVISAMGGRSIPEQEKIIAAIVEAGTVKRFLPSEFGNDVDHAQPLEPLKYMYDKKVAIRRKIEESGIPYTYISSNSFAGHTLAKLMQFGKTAPPRDKVVIYGTGDVKAIFLKEEDVGTYTIKTIDDPRTLNKVVYLRPPQNILTINEVVGLWEKKIGQTLEKEYVSEEAIVEQIKDFMEKEYVSEQAMLERMKTSPPPKNALLATVHSTFVMGDQYNFDIGEKGVDACALYPDLKYTTASEYLDKFV
ncbi:hypothetical protein GOP47_0006540 [Adiantum capillus-veneris]|uniref:NmrA-like domain-containing protein n=1 Tax=Adiantum capillus-veneris TaxID=13818 RepID=A0A9D4V324_ADICA|nr:hypothetical protein GOP47_0006540 [Adiantum capillus-veneris]